MCVREMKNLCNQFLFLIDVNLLTVHSCILSGGNKLDCHKPGGRCKAFPARTKFNFLPTGGDCAAPSASVHSSRDYLNV